MSKTTAKRLQPESAVSHALGQWLFAAAVVVLTCVAYIPAMRAGYIWDDDYYVYQNHALESGQGLWRIWTHLGETPQYYPLTHTSFWIEHQLWGNAPTGYHVVNVLLHSVSAVVLWRLLRRLKVPGAPAIAMLFAVHPVCVESVAWVTERKNTLSGLFYLLAFSVYWRMLGDPDEDRAPQFGWTWYALASALFVAALLSKTVTSTLPAAILLVLWWKRGQLTWKDALPMLPMILLAACMGSITSYMERTEVGAFGPDWQFTPVQRLLIAGRAVWFYACKLIFPADLMFIYPRWKVDPANWLQWLYPAGAAAAVAALFALRKRIGRGPLTAVLFFAGTLFPALGFFNTFPMLFSFVADHFQYLASIGILALVVGSVASFRAIPSAAKVTLATIAVLACTVLTWRQCHDYLNLPTLYTNTLQKNSHAWMAANNLAYLYVTEAESAAPGRKAELLGKARPLLEQALTDKPDHVFAKVNLGRVLDATGEPAKARDLWQGVIDAKGKVNPKSWPPAAADACFYIGRQYQLAQDPENAAKWYQEALGIDPGHVPSMTQLGTLLAGSGRFAEGVTLIRKAAELSPGTPSVWTNLGNLYMGAQQAADAAEAYERALQIKPDHIPARYGLATSQIALGQYGPAERILRDLLQLRPDSPEVLSALGGLLIKTGRLAEAQACLERALQVRPGFPVALRNMELLQSERVGGMR